MSSYFSCLISTQDRLFSYGAQAVLLQAVQPESEENPNFPPSLSRILELRCLGATKTNTAVDVARLLLQPTARLDPIVVLTRFALRARSTLSSGELWMSTR